MKRSIKEIRCTGTLPDGGSCRKLLGEEAIGNGAIKIRCHKCGHDNIISYGVPKPILDKLAQNQRSDLIVELLEGGETKT